MEQGVVGAPLAPVGLAVDAHLAPTVSARKTAGALEGAIAGPIVHQQHLVIGVVQGQQRSQHGLHRLLFVVGGHQDRDPGPGSHPRSLPPQAQHVELRFPFGGAQLGEQRPGLHRVAVEEKVQGPAVARPDCEQVVAAEQALAFGKLEPDE